MNNYEVAMTVVERYLLWLSKLDGIYSNCEINKVTVHRMTVQLGLL